MAQIDSAEAHWGELRNNFARWAPKIKQFFLHNPQSIDPSTYPKLQWAGSGAFGTVIKATFLFQDGSEQSYALKFIPLLGRPIAEIGNIYRIPRHPSIVKYYGWFPFESYALVGMELCDGTLIDYMSCPPFTQYSREQQRYVRWYILQQISEGLHQCHTFQMIHRDIKPQNSFLYSRNPITGQPTFKLGDFGIARGALSPGQIGTVAGCIAYMAPEVFTGQYSHQADIFSLGKVMTEIATKSTNSVPPPNSRWWSLAQQLTGYDPYKRLLAWRVRDAATEALNSGVD